MTAELRATPARVALLQAVADGEVHGSFDGRMVFTAWRTVDGRSERIPNNRFHELKSAGWIRIGAQQGDSYYSGRPVELTAAGRTVLDNATSKEV